MDGGAVAVSTVQRYSPAMQAVHWLVALLMFAALPLAWTMTSLPQDSAHRALFYTLHKSVGVTILALVAVRLALRTTRPIPPEPAGTSRPMAAAARASHWLLYAVLILMPVSGYLLSGSSGHPVSYFGLFGLPSLGDSQTLRRAGRTVHLLGQWAVYALVGLHLLATAYHVAVRRDGLLARMLPPQRIN